jgi:hypothetical protein
MPAVQTIITDVADGRALAGDATTALHPLSLLLAAGGDGRIWPDAVTGRNRYGTRTVPCDDEISFASTTASNVSAAGFAAADTELKRLFGVDGAYSSTSIDDCFATIRDRVARRFGSRGTEVILAASGTDIELFALGLVAGLSRRPMTNILIAPEETGSGIPRAAAGCHFSEMTALGRTVVTNAVLDGIAGQRIDVRTVPIRNGAGQPRHESEIDAEVIALVEQELKRDRDVLLHVLDTSKTGLTAVSRRAARYVASLSPGRVRVLVDACQLRCSGDTVRRDIADGFLVAVTGSKFLAGPPFSGALLVPASFAEEFAASPTIPAGLSDYTAIHDWPARLRERTRLKFGSHFNLGLGLRWIAALAQMDPLADIGEGLQLQIKRAFADLVRARGDDLPTALIHPDDEGDHVAGRAIVPLTILNGAGGFASLAQAQAIHLDLREKASGPVCHVGQAVHLGHRTILRVAASASDINAVSARMAGGRSLSEAMQPIADGLDIVFDKWAAVSRMVDGA